MKNKLFAAIALFAAAFPAWADADFITHRYDSFKACRVSDRSVVFIGNSITNMGNWHEHFADNPLVVNRGNSGACSYEALENLESILVGKPAKIFVMIGTNDIGTATGTPESIAKNGLALIERVKNESPETKVHIVSTFPSSNGLRSPENHAEINRLLKAVCEETQTTFIDLWDDMQGILDNSISADHLHVTERGYYIWSTALLPYLGDEFTCTLPATSEANNTYKWTNGNGLRVNMLASLPIKADDVLMIGGEMINNGEWHEMLNNQHVKNRAATYGYGDYLTADWKTFIGYMFDLNKSIKECPAQIYLNIGSQDINTNVALETLKANYRACVELLVAKAPGAALHLTSLTPHTDAAKNQRTKEFNTFVASLAEELNLQFVDLYAATVKADGTADERYITTELNAPYLSARGYLQLSRTLAPFIGNCEVESDDDFLARYEIINARQQLGNVISKTYTTVTGSTTGVVDAEAFAPVLNARPEMYALMNKQGVTTAELRQAYETYAPLCEAASKLNQPVQDKFYQIVSVRGDRVVNMTDPTAVVSTPRGQSDLNSTATMWEFRMRADKTWNIVNRLYPSMYLTPQATVSTTEPATGWTLSNHANYAGTYILSAGSAQFHQLTNGGITNWGGGSNTTDQGCAFYINELPDDYPAYDPDKVEITTEPEGTTEKKVIVYTITAERGPKLVSEAATGNWVLGSDGGSDLAKWYFYERTDGTFNICNVSTGNYIDPNNINASVGNQFMTSATEPTAGWTFTEIADAKGKYIITSGEQLQLHQAKSPWRIINWGYGSKNPGEFRTDDEGCRFSLSGTVIKNEETGIENIEAASTSTLGNAAYDLQGRRVRRPAHGLYIINGVKTVVR